MPTPEECGLLQTEYQDVLRLEAECTAALEEAIAGGDKRKIRSVKEAYLESLKTLTEKVNPFERLVQLRQKYESRTKLLKDLGLSEIKDGQEVIKGIDGAYHAIPTYQEVVAGFMENRELMKEKSGQGLSRLKMTPFAMSIDVLAEVWKQQIKKHFDAGNLYYTKANPNDSNEEPVRITDLNSSGALYIWDKYVGADKSGALVYHPQEFSDTHGGKTKQEVISEGGAWEIGLEEDLPNIPREGKGVSIGGRPQIDTKGTSIKAYIKKGETIPDPHEYLKALQSAPEYHDEEGMTPEDQIMYNLELLAATGQIMDDWQGNGSASYQLGAYFPASGFVPNAHWNRDYRQARLYRADAGDRDDDVGARSAVRVKRKKLGV